MRWLRSGFLGHDNLHLILWAATIGVIAGGAAAGYRLVAVRLSAFVWPAHPDLVNAVSLSPVWARLLVPTLGALLAGLVLMLGTRWAGPAKGWDILEAVVLRDGVLYLRPALVRCASSILTVASAGAVGREGPIVLLSSAVSSLAGRHFRLPTRKLRIIVACGAAAGIACAYNTPIGAALFTMEIIVGSFAMEVFAPLVFSSVVSTLISRAVFGGLPMFRVPAFSMMSGWEILPYTALGLLGGVTAASFLLSLRLSSSIFHRSRLPRPITMSIIGLVLGIAVTWFPDVVGNGREAIRHLFEGSWSISLALTLLVLRLVLTSATVGSGTVGGVFTPTLFLGAVLGDAFGSALHALLPSTVAMPKGYALVGMGSLLAGTTHAPLTAAVMIFEMTLDYNLILPLLLASAAASLVARSLSRESVYTEALKRKRGAMSGDAAAMSNLTVRNLMRSEQMTVSGDFALPRILERFISARRNHLYVVDKEGCLEGVIALHDANRALQESDDPSRILAHDLADRHFEVTTADEHLDRVLERFWNTEAERLPVVDRNKNCSLLGSISRRDILGLYSLEILHWKSMLARFGSADESGDWPAYVELPPDYEMREIPVPFAVVGMTIAESRFRDRYGLSILMIRRVADNDKETRLIPDAGASLLAGDRLTVIGPIEKFLSIGSEAGTVI